MRYDYDLSTSGGRLKYIRIRKGMSQKKLSETIGISLKQLQRYELNQVEISGYYLKRICEVFKIDVNYLLLGIKKGD